MLQRLTRNLLGKPLGFCAAALLALTLALPVAAEALPFGQGLLWRVQRDGGPANYVLGTIHSTDARLRDLPGPVRQALEASSDVAFEFIGTPEQQQTMAQAMQLPQGQRLEEHLGPELFQRTVSALSELRVKPEDLQGLKPWALSIFLIFPPVELVRQAQGEAAFDFWLQAEAVKLGKRLHSLETIEEQIEIFDGMSPAAQVAMVTDMLADYADITARFNRLFRAYLKGDIAAIMTEADEVSEVGDAAVAEGLTTRLLDDRNRLMATRMLPLLNDGGAFVAIGAAHLPGDDGVLALLEQRGYRITRAY